MAVNVEMAHLSDVFFTSAIATYALSTVCYTAEYAFGRRGRVAATVVVSAQRSRVLVGSGGSQVDAPASVDPVNSAPADPWAKVDAAKLDRSGRTGDRFGRVAIAVTVLGALIHATSLIIRGVAVDRVPWGNMYEFASLAGLISVIAFLAVLSRMTQVRYLGMFVMFPVIILMFLAGTVWYVRAQPLVPALQSYWLAIHVASVASAEGVLMTSAVMTALYLMRQRYDRRLASGAPMTGFAANLGSRLPVAAAMDKAAYRAVAFAFPIYTFGVICGAIWAEAAWGRYWGWDPKETWAFIAWVIYAAYLHARATAGWRGRAAAWINLTGFAAMTFNFFVVNVVIAGLHSYSGL
jgi:cytochrome c-type biogenesis protein CcsB